MADTSIEIDVNTSPNEHNKLHSRQHSDTPMLATAKPGDDSMIKLFDWAGGQINSQVVHATTLNSEERIDG